MRIATIVVATALTVSLSGAAWAQAAAGGNNGTGATGSQEGTMNNPASVNGRSPAGSTGAGGASSGSMSRDGNAMRSGAGAGGAGTQPTTPVEPTPGR